MLNERMGLFYKLHTIATQKNPFTPFYLFNAVSIPHNTPLNMGADTTSLMIRFEETEILKKYKFERGGFFTTPFYLLVCGKVMNVPLALIIQYGQFFGF